MEKRQIVALLKRLIVIPCLILAVLFENLPATIASSTNYWLNFFSFAQYQTGSSGSVITKMLTFVIFVLCICYIISSHKGFLNVAGLMLLAAIFSSLWPILLECNKTTIINVVLPIILGMEYYIINLTTYEVVGISS